MQTLRIAIVLTAALAAAGACSKSNDVSEDMDEVAGDAASPSGDAGGSLADAGLDASSGATGDAGNRLDSGTRDGGSMQRPQQECPAAVPANGSACVSGRGDCTIGDTFCDCPSDTNQWICWKPSDCPTSAPAEGAACTQVGMACEIAAADAGAQELDCECTAQGWDCGRQACPAAEPAVGAACEGGDGVCTFGARTCDCGSRQWVCWNASDCPAAPPAANAACPVQRMQCAYPGDECECTRTGWECESGEDDERDAGPRPDAGGGDAGSSDAAVDAAQAG
jgi:hypothetical protein